MSGKTKALVLAVTIITAALGGAMLTSSAPNDSVEMFEFTIRFEGVEYDVGLNESKWTYKVEGSPNALYDLSYWDLGLCAPNLVVAQQGGRYRTSHPDWSEVDVNPDTNINGIKFAVEVDKGGAEEFWFVLQGNWEIGEVEIGAKADQSVEVSTIQGPVCIPVPCQVQYSVEYGRTDFRVLRPGTYASVLSVIHLSGTGEAKISFDEFDAATYLADPGAAPIEIHFLIGDTLAAVDAAEWISADEFNDSVLHVSAVEMEGGVTFTVWLRLLVEEHHFSSDYEITGKMMITTECLH